MTAVALSFVEYRSYCSSLHKVATTLTSPFFVIVVVQFFVFSIQHDIVRVSVVYSCCAITSRTQGQISPLCFRLTSYRFSIVIPHMTYGASCECRRCLQWKRQLSPKEVIALVIRLYFRLQNSDAVVIRELYSFEELTEYDDGNIA